MSNPGKIRLKRVENDVLQATTKLTMARTKRPVPVDELREVATALETAAAHMWQIVNEIEDGG